MLIIPARDDLNDVVKVTKVFSTAWPEYKQVGINIIKEHKIGIIIITHNCTLKKSGSKVRCTHCGSDKTASS